MGGMGVDMGALLLRALRALLGTALDDRHGEPRHTHQPLTLVADLDVPHVTAAAEMERARRRGDGPRGQAAHVIGVDLLPEHYLCVGVDAQHGSDAAEGLRERYRGTAMQQPEWLMSTLVHRHGRAQEIRPDPR